MVAKLGWSIFYSSVTVVCFILLVLGIVNFIPAELRSDIVDKDRHFYTNEDTKSVIQEHYIKIGKYFESTDYIAALEYYMNNKNDFSREFQDSFEDIYMDYAFSFKMSQKDTLKSLLNNADSLQTKLLRFQQSYSDQYAKVMIRNFASMPIVTAYCIRRNFSDFNLADWGLLDSGVDYDNALKYITDKYIANYVSSNKYELNVLGSKMIIINLEMIFRNNISPGWFGQNNKSSVELEPIITKVRNRFKVLNGNYTAESLLLDGFEKLASNYKTMSLNDINNYFPTNLFSIDFERMVDKLNRINALVRGDEKNG